MDWLVPLGQFISSVGFPVAVAGYLLFRHDRTIHELTEAIRDLRSCLRGWPEKGA